MPEVNLGKVVGPKGSDGAQGPAGADGLSAYEQAQAGGYSGSELEFNQQLAGLSDGPFVPESDKGVASGVATLDSTGKVPIGQLPSMDYIPTSQKGAASGVASLDSSGQLEASQKPDYTASEVGAVPTTRTVNGKALSADVTLTGDDIPTSASDPTTISSQLSNRVNSIPVVIDPTVDVLTLKSGHVYTVEGEISKTYNHPIDAVYNHLTYNVYGTEDGSNGYKSIICKEAYSNRIWIKTQQYKLWLNWELVSLATPPQEFVLPLADGFVHCDPGTKSTYSKSQEGLVVVHFYCKKADGTDIVQNDTIAMLPEGFHPSANVHIPANVSFDGSSVYSQDVATVVVGGNGRVWIAYPPAGCKAVTSTLVFYAAS